MPGHVDPGVERVGLPAVLLVEDDELGVRLRRAGGQLIRIDRGGDESLLSPDRDATLVTIGMGPDGEDDALARPHARPMDFTGKPMRGYVYVAGEGAAEDDDLAAWVARGLAFTASLPPK